MFTEIDINSANIEDIYEFCIGKLDDSMLILKNNSKVLSFLTDDFLSQELNIIVKSLSMAFKHARFELVQNIILGMKDNVHKLAALEIRYFDENETLLRTDLYNAFMPQNMKKHAFVSPRLKELFDILDKTIKLSPTNAAFAIQTFFEISEFKSIHFILEHADLGVEFLRQIHKRYEANFGMTIHELWEKCFNKNRKLEKNEEKLLNNLALKCR